MLLLHTTVFARLSFALMQDLPAVLLPEHSVLTHLVLDLILHASFPWCPDLPASAPTSLGRQPSVNRPAFCPRPTPPVSFPVNKPAVSSTTPSVSAPLVSICLFPVLCWFLPAPRPGPAPSDLFSNHRSRTLSSPALLSADNYNKSLCNLSTPFCAAFGFTPRSSQHVLKNGKV